MTFKEWCFYHYGIIGFSNKHSINTIFIPALTSSNQIELSPALKKAGAYIIEHTESNTTRGIAIEINNFNELIDSINYYFLEEAIDAELYEPWLQEEFAKSGVSFKDLKKKKERLNLVISFASNHHAALFKINFKTLLIAEEEHLKMPALQFPPLFSEYLYKLYQETELQTVYNFSTIPFIDDYKAKLATALSTALHFIDPINIAHQLTCEPTADRLGFFIYGGIGYCLSLKIYADTRKDSFTAEEYLNLYDAADFLYNQRADGMQTCVVGECLTALYIVALFISSCSTQKLGDLPLFSQLDDKGGNILSLIYDDISRKLHGSYSVSTDLPRYHHNRRFLPDTNMQSDTDDIICLSANSSSTSVFRILKVGINLLGQRALFNEIPFYFRYFKVEYSLEEHEVDTQQKMCVGTHITELIPYHLVNETLVRSMVDPLRNPVEYQQAMEFTISSLLSVERKLLLYKKMLDEKNMPITQLESSEYKLWHSLTSIKNILSGIPHTEPVTYFARDPSRGFSGYSRTVQNQKHILDPDYSKPFMVLDTLVNSFLGDSLTTCHKTFLQSHTAQQHVEQIQRQIIFLDKLRLTRAPIPKTNLRWNSYTALSFFKGKETPVNFSPREVSRLIKLFRESSLAGAVGIKNLTRSGDKWNSHVKINFVEKAEAENFKKSLKKVPLEDHVNIVERQLIMNLRCFKAICQYLKIDYDRLDSVPNLLNGPNI